MTFKDLQKVIQSQQSGPEQTQVLQRLRDKPFWIWDSKQHKQEDITGRSRRSWKGKLQIQSNNHRADKYQ